MNINLTTKISFTIILLLAFALGMISLLNFFKYEKTFSSLLQSRFVVLALDLKNTLENNLNLGLALPELQNADQIIQRIAQQDPEIVSIDIFDEDGKIIFSSTNQSSQAYVPRNWLRAQSHIGKSIFWNITEESAFVVGAPLINNFDKTIGGIALQSSKAYHESRVSQMFWALAQNLLIVLVVSTILTAISVFFLFRRLTWSFACMEESLQPLLNEQHEPHSNKKLAPKELNNSELEQQFSTFRQHAQRAIEDMQDVSGQVTNSLQDQQQSIANEPTHESNSANPKT